MTKRAKNTPIGEVLCPHKGCDQVCKVYTFRPRTEGHKSVFSGKHYAECPVHGRIGSDGNPAITDYILEHGKIWGATDRPAPDAGPGKPAKSPDPAPNPKPAPKPPAAPPAPNVAPAPDPGAGPAPERGWRPLIH